MTTETSGLIVEQQATADIAKPPTPGEMTMAEYAENWGKKPEPVTETPAAPPATEETAAADHVEAEKTTEQAADEKPEDPESQIEDTHPAKKGISKRFSEMSAKQRELQSLADAEKARADALAAEMQQLREAAAKPPEPVIPMVVPEAEDPRPDRNAYDDPDEYALALAGYTARAEIRRSTAAAIAAQNEREAAARQAQEAARQAKVQEQITALHKTFNERVEKAQADYPDFAEKVTNNQNLVIRNDIFFAVEQVELAPHVLYHLASNPTEMEALNRMSPIEAAVKLGEIQAEIRQARKPKPSRAAEPVKPITARSNPGAKRPEDMSMEEYAAYATERDKAAAALKQRQRR